MAHRHPPLIRALHLPLFVAEQRFLRSLNRTGHLKIIPVHVSQSDCRTGPA